VRDLLDEIDAAAAARIYFLALSGALTVPDIAGALGNESGEAVPSRYDAWVRANLPRWADDADLLRQYRNAVLHQHRGALRPEKGRPRLIWIEPHAGERMHMVRSEDFLMIDVRSFCAEMTSAARAWMARERANPIFKRNLAASFRRHPKGLERAIVGRPVIA